MCPELRGGGLRGVPSIPRKEGGAVPIQGRHLSLTASKKMDNQVRVQGTDQVRPIAPALRGSPPSSAQLEQS